jgi:hypothetical protein
VESGRLLDYHQHNYSYTVCPDDTSAILLPLYSSTPSNPTTCTRSPGDVSIPSANLLGRVPTKSNPPCDVLIDIILIEVASAGVGEGETMGELGAEKDRAKITVLQMSPRTAMGHLWNRIRQSRMLQ